MSEDNSSDEILPTPTIEAGVTARDAIEAAKVSLNMLAMLLMPEVFTLLFPDFFQTIFDIVTKPKKAIERFALGIPRGFAKTTWVKLVCAWYILFSDRKFILIVCASEELAVNIVADVIALLSHPNVRTLFGRWDADVEEDQKHKKVFTFRGRKIIIQGIGVNTSVRGISRNFCRPDIIIFDDAQDKEIAKDPEQTKALFERITSTIMKTRDPQRCTYIWLGNMYPENAILEKLQNNPLWTSLVVGGILADGTSLWEELRSIESLVDEYESDLSNGMGHVFLAEVMNKPGKHFANGLDPSLIPECPEWYEDGDFDGSYIIIDPAGNKIGADDTTIERFGIKDGKHVFDSLEQGTFTPIQTIEAALNIGFETGTRLICVENVAYQASLLFWFEYICQERGISGFHFMPVSPKNQNKNARIKKALVQFIKGEAYISKKVRSRYIEQASAWDITKQKNRDDVIDPPGYMDEITKSYLPLAAHMIIESNSRQPSIRAAHSSDLDMPF